MTPSKALSKFTDLSADCGGSNKAWDDFKAELTTLARAACFLWDGPVWQDALDSTGRSQWIEFDTLPLPEIFILTFSHIDTHRQRSLMIRSTWTITEALLHIHKCLCEPPGDRPYSYKMGIDES